MKKRLLVIATTVAFAFSFTACDEAGLEDIINNSDIVGHITLYTSQAGGNQAYGNGDTLNFKSAVCNVKLDTLGATIEAGTLLVGTTDNILTTEENANITYPLVGINLRGDTTGRYTVSAPVDQLDFFRQLDSSDVMSMLVNGVDLGDYVGNIFMVAASEHAYYIGYEGTVQITEFGNEGALVKGNVTNVKCIYVLESQLEQLANGTLSYGTLPTIFFNGDVSSRRTNIEAVIAALDEMGDEQ